MISEIVEPTVAFTMLDLDEKPRKCYNKNGKPKRAFPCKSDATLHIRHKHLADLHVYPCEIHGWHMGH